MTFEKLTTEWKNQLRSLWREVFKDEWEYIDLFFDNCYEHAEAMGAIENNKLLAMLFLLPMTLHTKTDSFDAAYIYAVATDPEERGKGISTKLLEETHRYLKENGTDLSVLVPASESLFDFYAKRGYSSQFYLDFIDWEYKASDKKIPLQSASLDSLKDIRDKFFSDCDIYCEYDKQQLLYREKEARFLGGKTLAFSLDRKDGYAVCIPFENAVLIKEYCFDYDERVFAAIAEYFDVKQLKIRMKGSQSPFAMSYWYEDTPDYSDGNAYISLVLD